MPVILGGPSKVSKSAFETQHFDAVPAMLNGFTAQSFSSTLGGNTNLTDDDIRDLAGAPSGSKIEMRNMTNWGYAGEDRPSPGLYLYTTHRQHIIDANRIGLCFVPGQGYHVYIKDVFFSDHAPQGMGVVALARVVRFCLRYGVPFIRLYAAGGRTWPDIINFKTGQNHGRWLGYYVWPKCGFDMPLVPDDLALIKHFAYPKHLSACARVSEVLKGNGGIAWWAMCGTGHFMEFDSSSEQTASVAVLEAYLVQKGF